MVTALFFTAVMLKVSYYLDKVLTIVTCKTSQSDGLGLVDFPVGQADFARWASVV